MLRDYEELICDIKDEALFECAEEFFFSPTESQCLRFD